MHQRGATYERRETVAFVLLHDDGEIGGRELDDLGTDVLNDGDCVVVIHDTDLAELLGPRGEPGLEPGIAGLVAPLADGVDHAFHLRNPELGHLLGIRLVELHRIAAAERHEHERLAEADDALGELVLGGRFQRERRSDIRDERTNARVGCDFGTGL